jgi:hypothetical protein
VGRSQDIKSGRHSAPSAQGDPTQSLVDRARDRGGAKLLLRCFERLFIQVDQVLCHSVSIARAEVALTDGA